MTTLTLELEQFTSAITKAIIRTLPWTWLTPISAPSDELTPPSFISPPPSNMAGYSFSGLGPATNINGFTDNSFIISDGIITLTIVLNVTGKTTGDLIAAELEDKINAGFATAGSITQVRVEYYNTIQYRMYSLTSASVSAIMLFPAGINNIADNLKLGVVYGGTEGLGTYSLVDSSEYRFPYKSLRYIRFTYLLERDGLYEAGELSVIHDLVIADTSDDELTPPSITPPFIPPTISTYQSVSIGGIGSLGVVFSFIHDATTDGADAKFGLAFRIINSIPEVYPKLTMSYITAFPPEDI